VFLLWVLSGVRAVLAVMCRLPRRSRRRFCVIGVVCRRNANVIPTAGFITRVLGFLSLDRGHFLTCISSFADSSEIRRIGATVSIVRG
jgi:hypothetical protein